MAQVVLDHLTKAFKGPAGEAVRAVDNASLVVHDRELLVLVGPSGCGKTTTLRLIAGLEQPDSGTVSLAGRVVNNLSPKDRDVAMVFQNHALYPHMTVYDNLAFGLKIRRFPEAESDRRVRDTAQLLDLTSCLGRRPAALSGGQRQRVALGRALVRHPTLLLLDEPLSNLDAQTRLQLRAEIARLHARLGATMLYVTHDQTEALTLGQRVAVMHHGAIQQVDTPLNLYHRPANLFVAGFIGSPPMNFFAGTLIEQGAAVIFQETARNPASTAKPLALQIDNARTQSLRPCIGKPIVLGIRPEHILVELSPGTAAVGAIQAVIEHVQPTGSETYLHLAGHTRTFIVRVPPEYPARPNQSVPLLFDLLHVHLFDPAAGTALV
jgi:multiple sugar transport system ATP-binding protein